MQTNPRSPEIKSRLPGRGRRPSTTTAGVSTAAAPTLNPDAAQLREESIARAAYFLAERDGFPAGREMEYWLMAEAEVDHSAAKQKRE